MPEDVARDPLEELHPTAKVILVAARTVLRERGMAGLTLEAVANEANTSRTQVPYHFGSRAGLIEALFDWLFDEVWMRFLRPPGEALPMTVHESLEWSRQEMADLAAVRDAWDLVVHSLRDEMARKRLVLLYARDRRLEVETVGLGGGAGTPAPPLCVPPYARRRRSQASSTVSLRLERRPTTNQTTTPATMAATTPLAMRVALNGEPPL